MNIKLGDYYENKTWRFLLPCLRGHGDTFVRKINQTFRLAAGIHDTLLDGSPTIANNNKKCIYLLFDKEAGVIGNKNGFKEFLDWIVHQRYFVADYCCGEDLKTSRTRMIIIQVPDFFENAYDHFLKGEYSKMYSIPEIEKLFGKSKKGVFRERETERRNRDYKILRKDKGYKKEFLEKINKEFETKVSDIEGEDIELELPLKRTEEIFNCKEEQRTFFNENLDKVWI